jgi:prophage maintenance system killer protein
MSSERSIGQASAGEVVLYEAPDGGIRIDVRLVDGSVWLSLNQMAELFSRDKSVISRHMGSVFASGELDRTAVVADNATTASDGKTYKVAYYNLDAILSVGYRVNSRRGTQFRIWATGTLRDHLLRGYTLHERRLRERGMAEMEQAVALLASTLQAHELVTDEGQAVLDVVRRYARSWRLLRAYDEDRLPAEPKHPVALFASLDITEARAAIRQLRGDLIVRGEDPGLAGQERGDALESILLSIEQTFDGEPLYASVESRAAHLLYFVIKDHPLVDGNKRIGALLFLEYLRRNGALVNATGQPRFSDNALVALALLVAESNPIHKELIIRLILNLLVDDPA